MCHWFARSIAWITLVLTAGSTFAMNEDLPLKLVIDVQVDATAHLRIAANVQNTSSRSISRDIAAKVPPLNISVLDEAGHDLYWAALDSQYKHGKGLTRTEGNRSIPLSIPAGQQVTYLIDQVGVPGVGAVDGPLPPGNYKIQLRLATAERIGDVLQPTLITSNVVSVTVR